MLEDNIQNFYYGKKGLDNAKQEILSFKTNNKNIPKITDPEMKQIRKAIRKKYWQGFKIIKWTNLISYCGLEPQKLHSRKNDNIKEIYYGKKGLELAKQEILSFKTKHLC